MVRCRIADFNIIFENRYDFVKSLCSAYRAEFSEADYIIRATEAEILREKQLMGEAFSLGYCEATCLYRNLCNSILAQEAFLLHGAAVEYGGRSCVYLGRSGVGKSTHAQLLKEYCPEVTIINIDKPIIRRIDGSFYAYGSPWCGKEVVQTRTRAIVSNLCFLEQSSGNEIRKLESGEAVERFFHQLLIPKDAVSADKLLALADGFLKSVGFYLLRCNVSRAAAEMSFNTLLK
ncbi:MAG: hypothetical protein Q4C01_05775 [Clostridia bacterium]|nr:hypothetical protein [Clostridia bacterium]